MSVTNPAQAATEAIVSALQTAMDAALPELDPGTILVRDGWPDAQEGIPSGTYLTVTSGDLVQEPHKPIPWSSTTAGGVVTQLYGVATWLMNVQVDLFADFKDQRDPLVPFAREVFTDIPFSGNAALTLSGYHSTQMRVKVTSESDDDPKGTIGGRWRHTFEIEAQGKIIVDHDWFELQTLALDINGTLTTLE